MTQPEPSAEHLHGDDRPEPAGEAACALHRVCDACGALEDGPLQPVCGGCGATRSG